MDLQEQQRMVTFCNQHNDEILLYQEGQGLCKVCLMKKVGNAVLAEDHEQSQKNLIKKAINLKKSHSETYKLILEDLYGYLSKLEKGRRRIMDRINYFIKQFDEDNNQLSKILKGNYLNFSDKQYQEQLEMNQNRTYKLKTAYQDFIQQTKFIFDETQKIIFSKLDLLKGYDEKNPQPQAALNIKIEQKQIDYKCMFQEQCPQGRLCQIIECQSKHYRFLAGICIQGMKIDTKQGKCNNIQCKLYHFSKKALKKELDVQPINGIFRFNLCKITSCKQQNNCSFLHPQWAQRYCIDYLMDDCKEAHKNHVKWNDIRSQVYLEYYQKLKMKYNPEENLDAGSHYFKINNICMKYLQGLCGNKNGYCVQKNHIFWEDLDQIRNLKQSILSPCTKSYDSLQSQSLFVNPREYNVQRKAFKESNIIDLIFIMDITESMERWMDICKSQIKGIVETFQSSIQTCALRIGMVCYRDIGDDQQITYNDLTSDIKMITNFIAKQQAKSKGDDAEDIFSGIEKAMTLNISKHINSILITILFADAPCHGKQYHNGVSDKLADKVPPNTLENLMKRYYNMKKNNIFTCVNISPQTKKMFKIMQENFPGLFMSEFSQLNQFQKLNDLIKADSLLINQQVKQRQFSAIFQKPKLSGYNITNHQEQDFFWENFEQQFQKIEGETFIEISKSEFDNYSSNFVFKCYDVVNNQQIIVKIPKDIAKMNYEKQTIADNILQQYEENVEIKFINQAKIRQLACIFREKTLNINGAPPIFFSIPIIYQLQDKKFLGLSKIYGEVFIDIPSAQWIKYSNNSNYFSMKDYYYSAFSHFALEETLGKLTITNLKGIKNLLSHPAIQSEKGQKDKRLSQENEDLGQVGIQYFMKQHQECSFICEKLKLQSFSGSKMVNQQRWESDCGKIEAFCESCDNQIELTQQEYLEKKYQFCQDCQARNVNTQDNFCQCCKEFVPINNNRCESCQIRCKIQNDKRCIYCNMSCTISLNDIIIGGNEIIICKKGNKYLETLQCQICKEDYDFQVVLEQQKFQKGEFYCGGKKCKKN